MFSKHSLSVLLLNQNFVLFFKTKLLLKSHICSAFYMEGLQKHQQIIITMKWDYLLKKCL